MDMVHELRARHARLTTAREANQKQLAHCQEQEIGFRYVLGELEAMIAELEVATERAAGGDDGADTR